MRTTRLVAASALSALLLLPMGAAARTPRTDASVSPAAGFTATITAKAYTRTLAPTSRSAQRASRRARP